MHKQHWRELVGAGLIAVGCFAGAVALSPHGIGADPVGSAEPVRSKAVRDPQSAVVDSVRPIAEELARFRAGLGRPAPRELAGGARSRDGLVQAFMQALEQQDTARLAAMAMDAAEFAWFYYPYTIYTHPPYTQAPGMVWMLTTQNGQKGLARLLRRYGGRPLDNRGYRCGRVEPQDLNRLHLECGVLIGPDQAPARLFGTIIERNGRFKFVSYANGL